MSQSSINEDKLSPLGVVFGILEILLAFWISALIIIALHLKWGWGIPIYIIVLLILCLVVDPILCMIAGD